MGRGGHELRVFPVVDLGGKKTRRPRATRVCGRYRHRASRCNGIDIGCVVVIQDICQSVVLISERMSKVRVYVVFPYGDDMVLEDGTTWTA